MSTQRVISFPLNAEKYYPNYAEADRDVRVKIRARIREHLQGRRNHTRQCVNMPVQEIRDAIFGLHVKAPPSFEDNDDIINGAFKAVDDAINKWRGVQFHKTFCDQFEKDGKPMTDSKFQKNARNHQDTTSWTVSGDHFFAPYIRKSKKFLYEYCQCITNVDDTVRKKVFNLACIAYAESLLTAEIAFYRTAQKPLLRHKTIVKSEGVKTAFEELYPPLTVNDFYDYALKQRKEKEKKSTVLAKPFYENLLKCVKTLHWQQKINVYNALNVTIPTAILNANFQTVYPKDLMAPERDEHDGSDSSTISVPFPTTPPINLRYGAWRGPNHCVSNHRYSPTYDPLSALRNENDRAEYERQVSLEQNILARRRLDDLRIRRSTMALNADFMRMQQIPPSVPPYPPYPPVPPMHVYLQPQMIPYLPFTNGNVIAQNEAGNHEEQLFPQEITPAEEQKESSSNNSPNSTFSALPTPMFYGRSQSIPPLLFDPSFDPSATPLQPTEWG